MTERRKCKIPNPDYGMASRDKEEYIDGFFLDWVVVNFAEIKLQYTTSRVKAIVEIPDSPIEGYNSIVAVNCDELFLVSPETLWDEERKRQMKQLDRHFMTTEQFNEYYKDE